MTETTQTAEQIRAVKEAAEKERIEIEDACRADPWTWTGTLTDAGEE
jgi:hypothetical protein